ncbi:ABC transporter substrate-binding protein [Breoghania sp. JC706]|uniref:ABC transporter substrate-binding protein n=1 Tax=Breoghania sp. JC706 TaxID=3117732 RepID=UPI00300B9F97
MKSGVRLIAGAAALAVATLSSAAFADEPAETVGSGIPALKADKTLNALLPEKIQKAGKIVIVTDAHYPPCQYFAADNETIVGYEPDLWKAMTEKLGITYDVKSIDFAGLIPGVESGRYDMAAECISDNAERQERVTFIDDAYASGAVFTLETNKTITSDPDSLCGLTVAIQQGFDFVNVVNDVMTPHCTSKGLKPITVNQYPSGDATLLALYSHRVDFVLNDIAASEEIRKRAPEPIRIVENPYMPKYYNGMVVKKDNEALANALLAALKAVHEEGVYDKIMAKWDISLLALKEPGINLATKKPIEEPKP